MVWVAWSKKIIAYRHSMAILALLAVLVFLTQSLVYAHHQDVTMDEGTYLMKGLLFVRGTYRPFQDYGPWTNKMPLAFIIPGIAQYLFGPGLRTGRYFSIFLALLTLLGLWWLARRLGGRGWATELLWLLAINPAVILYYSLAISQVIVACQMAWMLALALGERRPLWQTTLAAALAGMMLMTRQNMLPVVPLLVLYIFWQHGWRAGGLALAAVGLVVGIGHWLYWPQILDIWRNMLPAILYNWLMGTSAATASAGAAPASEGLSATSRWYIFWEAMRLFYFPLMGALITWLLWPRLREWKSIASFRAAVFLSLLLVGLTAAHLWAALWKDYCPYCYAGYLTFFLPVGLILVVVAAPSWVRWPGLWRQMLAVLLTGICCTGIGFGAQQELDDWLLNLPVPRLRNLQLQGSSTELWRALTNKFGPALGYENLQILLPTVAGAAVGALLLLAAWLVYRRLARAGSLRMNVAAGFGYFLLIVLLALGSLLSPTALFAGSKLALLCDADVIASHEAVGAHLARLVPPGSLVYWMNDISPLPLLYLPGVRIFPPQLNHWYNYLKGGDPQQAARRGFWNAELARQWREQADYLLIADKYMNSFSKDEIMTRLDELAPSPETLPCRDRSIIHVLRRIR